MVHCVHSTTLGEVKFGLSQKAKLVSWSFFMSLFSTNMGYGYIRDEPKG